MRADERSLLPDPAEPPATAGLELAGEPSGNVRWAGTDDQVFELDDLGTPVRLLRGQFVRVQTIWGHERGQVLRLGEEDGFPMAEVLMDMGDRIFIDIARCTLEEE